MDLQVSVSKRFPRLACEFAFSFSGERLGLFGASGSGKSTLVAMLAGLLTPDSGTISLDGEPFFASSRKINRPPEERGVAIVFQRPHLFPHLSVRGNLLYGHKRLARGRPAIDMAMLCAILKLDGLLERGVNRLSGGEKQRVAIGRAVLSHPRLLLMDEPLSALDDGLRYQIIPYLLGVCETFRIPFLFISHSLVEMQLMTEQVAVVEGGRVTGRCTVEELARQRMRHSPLGYVNLLRLSGCRAEQGLFRYPWGRGELLLTSEGASGGEGLFELSSREIILCKLHPQAVSARNLLPCTVVATFAAGNMVGVELECGGERLIAEVVAQAVAELDIRPGCELFAAVKASAFRRLGQDDPGRGGASPSA